MEKTLKVIVLWAASFFLVFLSALAYVAESTNYKLQSDSVNVGGLDFSSSTSYKLDDTIGEIGVGSYESASQLLKAGYRYTEGDYTISISLPSNVTMTPAIDGINGGSSSGSVSWTVTTDNPAGYNLFLRAASSPALASTNDSFADYTSQNPSVPDFTWAVGTNAAEFGYTVEGNDTHSTFKDNGSLCSIGSSNTSDACWMAFSTSNREIARRSSSAGGGVATTVKIKAELGADKTVEDGSYSAEISVTALAL